MKRLPVLTVVLGALVAVLIAVVVALVVADDDDMDGRMGPGMMVAGAGATSEAGYLAEMVAHHREAVTAARELARSDRPEMRRLGEDVVRTQTAQIEQMTAWLDDWYPDQSLDVGYEPMMRDLTDLSGDRLDRTFLVDMVPHHMAAVMMSQHLVVRGSEHDEVADLAREIRDEQRAEIFVMRRWLADWFGVRGWGHAGAGMGSHRMWSMGG
jgi:uncharacterized protein (DUF305 family)